VAIGHKSRTRPKRVDASTMSGTQQLSPSTNEAGPRDKSMEIYDRPHSCCVCGFSIPAASLRWQQQSPLRNQHGILRVSHHSFLLKVVSHAVSFSFPFAVAACRSQHFCRGHKPIPLRIHSPAWVSTLGECHWWSRFVWNALPNHNFLTLSSH